MGPTVLHDHRTKLETWYTTLSESIRRRLRSKERVWQRENIITGLNGTD